MQSQLDVRFDPLSPLDETIMQGRWAKDDKLHVRFNTRPILNPLKSSEQGRAIYDEVDYITIFTPGSQLNVIESKIVGTKYESRFAKQYKAWKLNQQEIISGTPLESFPLLLGKVGLIAELVAINVHTVEQLAGLPDTFAQSIMGGMELRKRAGEWLEGTKGSEARILRMEQENEELRKRLAALEAKPK